MNSLFPHAAAPLAVGSKTMPNRIVIPPMADIIQKVPGNYVTEYMLQRYQAYTAGNPGMIVVEGSNVTEMRDVQGRFHSPFAAAC